MQPRLSTLWAPTDPRWNVGQQTYLNAMALGKLVIVTKAPGVGDYIENGPASR